MNILSILNNKIQYFSLSNPLIGKKKMMCAHTDISYTDAKKFNLDIWASYLKKLLLQTGTDKFGAQKTTLILGQRFFVFNRIEIPSDIPETALKAYTEKRILELYPDLLNPTLYKYGIADYRGMKCANIFILTPEVYTQLTTLLSFYELTIQDIYPEALLLFHLFEHTLNKKKEEPILFVEHHTYMSEGLLFDASGLLNGQVLEFESKNLTAELKKLNDKQAKKIARLILNGEIISKIRQDTFTKDVDIWTNPLNKILDNSIFAKTAQKYELTDILVFAREVSLLKLIDEKNNTLFGFTPRIAEVQKKPVLPSMTLPTTSFESSTEPNLMLSALKYSLFMILSFGLSFLVLKALLTGSSSFSFKMPPFALFKPSTTPVPTAIPTEVPSPTPSILREKVIIEIQNGVGTPGLANKARAVFEKKGYVVETVANADSYSYKKTVIIAPQKAIFSLISADLKEYGVTGATFEKTTGTKTTVIVGQDFAL
ncbi:MAG: LytR C-terminal domain-containing protein [Patescibacteria group bacterium]